MDDFSLDAVELVLEHLHIGDLLAGRVSKDWNGLRQRLVAARRVLLSDTLLDYDDGTLLDSDDELYICQERTL